MRACIGAMSARRDLQVVEHDLSEEGHDTSTW